MTAYAVQYDRIDEEIVPGKRLGRHGRIDSRSAAFPWRAPARLEVVDHEWDRHVPIFDQGDRGSCTGESEAGECGSDPFYTAILTAGFAAPDQDLALRFYSLATTLDGYPGQWIYPPSPGAGEDTGSDGTAVSQAAKQMGYVSGYLHATTVDDVLQALMRSPVKLGINWYSSMDEPNSAGVCAIARTATIRGGHEIVCRRVDAGRKLIGPDNSWSAAWGVKGSFWLSWADLDRLLHEGGDCTVSVPLTAPPPVPVPVPATPLEDYLSDERLARWAGARHVGDNGYAASRYLWLKGQAAALGAG